MKANRTERQVVLTTTAAARLEEAAKTIEIGDVSLHRAVVLWWDGLSGVYRLAYHPENKWSEAILSALKREGIPFRMVYV